MEYERPENFLELKTHQIDICAISRTKQKDNWDMRYNNHMFFYSSYDKHSELEDMIDKMKYIDSKYNGISNS